MLDRMCTFREPSGKARPLLLIAWYQLVMNSSIIGHKSKVLFNDSPHRAVATVDLQCELSQWFWGVVVDSRLDFCDEFWSYSRIFFCFRTCSTLPYPGAFRKRGLPQDLLVLTSLWSLISANVCVFFFFLKDKVYVYFEESWVYRCSVYTWL